MAERVGIACPRTFMTSEDENLEDVSRKITYPAVIKPRFSRFLRGGAWASGSVQYAGGREELIAKYHESSVRIPGPLVQERIVGEGRGVFLLVWDGELKAAFGHRRLREKPPWGGVSVYSETVPLDSALVQQSLELLQAIRWQGPAMVEFKLDERDGRAKFMEVNGRFWGSLQLAIDAGVNFPLLLYRLALGESVPVQRDYRVGIRSRWLLGDLDNLLIRLRGRNWPNGLPGSDRSKLKATLDFLKLYESNSRFDVLRFGDLGPGWFEFKDYVRATLRSLRRHSSAAVSSEGRST
jgi:predicted ATP-grasp superfamily ATP-dependent carboligase